MQTEMTTRCELAFKALDLSKTGYINEKQIKKLTPKLSSDERAALMTKVIFIQKYYMASIYFC